jgi:hypothetical protein
MQWNRVYRIWSRRDGSLFSPLTLWLVPGSQLRPSWPCYFDYRRKFLCIGRDQRFLQLALYDGSFIEGIEVEWSPHDHCYPVEATPCASTWHVTQPIHPTIDSVSPFIPATIPELITTLELREQEMLQHLTLHVPSFQLIQELLDTSEANDMSTNIWQMLFASDGSELHQMMSFGWVLSTPTGARLARCYGPATGPNTSHRAEATSMLAASRLLLRLSQFCNCNHQWHVRYVSDNEGLITRATNRSKYTHSFPNATLAPDWDLVEEIYVTNATLNATASYRHVLGHQDRHKKYVDLPLDAQLNVEQTKKLATFNLCMLLRSAQK